VAERFQSAERPAKGGILDELRATTGRHRQHAARALRQQETVLLSQKRMSESASRYGAMFNDLLTALRKHRSSVGKRLK
jgi:hypothetical protein